MAPTTPFMTPPTPHGNADSRPAQPLPIKGPANVSNLPVAPDSASPTGGEDLPLPHERDESVDSGQGEPSERMRQAMRDLNSGKRPTDGSEVTDEVYERTLRDDTPGAERDEK